MSDVQTHMHVQDAIETAILDRGVEPPADLADIVFAAARAALESAPSSLRAELAEARAEIARLTAENGKHRADYKRRGAEIDRSRAIVEAATALQEHHVRQPVTRLAAVHSKDHELCELLDKLVAAVEEGDKP